MFLLLPFQCEGFSDGEPKASELLRVGREDFFLPAFCLGKSQFIEGIMQRPRAKWLCVGEELWSREREGRGVGRSLSLAGPPLPPHPAPPRGGC